MFLNSANRAYVSRWLVRPHEGALLRVWTRVDELIGWPGLNTETSILAAFMMPTNADQPCAGGCSGRTEHAVSQTISWSVGELPNQRWPHPVFDSHTPHDLACIAAHNRMNGPHPPGDRTFVPELRIDGNLPTGAALGRVTIARSHHFLCTVAAGEPVEGVQPYQLLAELLLGVIRWDLAKEPARRLAPAGHG